MPSERMQRQIERMLDDVEEEAAARDWPLVVERAQIVLAGHPQSEDAAAFVRLAEAALAAPAGDGAATSTSAEERIQILKQLVGIAASSLDIAEVFDGVAQQVRRLIDFDHMAVALHRPGDDFLTIRAIIGEIPGELRSPLDGPGSGAVLRSGKPVINPDTLLNPMSPREKQLAGTYRSLLRLPLQSRGRAFGVLNFGAGQPNAYSEADLLVAQDVADHLAVVLDYSLRYEQVEEAGRMAERARLARELHDTLAQALTGVVLQLDAAEERSGRDAGAALDAVRTARELARETLEEARRSLWDLQPAALESGDLAGALGSEVRRSSSDDLDASFRLTGEVRRVDPRSEEALLRIAQESLTNTRRHAAATTVEVSLDFAEAEVTLRIVDDGVGFEPDAPGDPGGRGDGFGLTSMQQRAHLVGGRIDVRSAPGKGTEVCASVPALGPGERPPAVSIAGATTAAALPDPVAAGEPIDVLIVDDHEIVRSGLREMLEADPGLRVVGEAADGETALREIERTAPDVVLLDIQMPGLDGVGTLQRMQEQGVQTPVLLLSVLVEHERILAGLRAGARGYLLKDVAREELCLAIRTLHRGGSLLPPMVADRLLDGHDEATSERLSPREREVLQLLATGVRNKEIAVALTISENTVRWHVANLHQKLDVTTRTEAVHVARERGLL